MLCQIFLALADILSEENPYFGKRLLGKTRTDYARASLRVEDFATGKNFSFNLLYYNKEICFFIGKVKAIESVFPCICIPWSKHSRGWENTRQFRDEVERVHNFLEFSQPLSCLY